MTEKKMTLRQGLESLVRNGKCDPGVIVRLTNNEVHPLSEEPFPWMLRFYFFLGASVAALLFLAFCLVLLAMESWGSLVGLGTALIIVGVWVTLRLSAPVWSIASLVVTTTGQLLVIGGLVLAPPVFATYAGGEMARATLGSLVMGVVLYPVVSLTLHRFVASFLPALFFGLWLLQGPYLFSLEVYSLIAVVFAAAILWQPLTFMGLRPLAGAMLAVGGFFTLAEASGFYTSAKGVSFMATHWLTFRLGMAVGVSALIILENQGQLNWRLGIALGGIVLLTLFWPSAVLLAVSLMVLGRTRGEQTLEVASLLLLVVAITQFYFRLDYPLHVKGVHLMASGVLLLGGSLLLRDEVEA